MGHSSRCALHDCWQILVSRLAVGETSDKAVCATPILKVYSVVAIEGPAKIQSIHENDIVNIGSQPGVVFPRALSR